jgi:hypothetical protein
VPARAGRRPTNLAAQLDYTDVTGTVGKRVCPIPELDVIGPYT